jgi:hypothetical protein
MYTIGVVIIVLAVCLSAFVHVFGNFTIYGSSRFEFKPKDHILSLIMLIIGVLLIYNSN